MELNPRFGGGYPFSHMSGANYPEAIINFITQNETGISTVSKNYNKAYAKCDQLIPLPDDFEKKFR